MGLILERLSYHQYKGKDNEWIIEDLRLGPINLITGKNAVGKSRTLTVLFNLGQILSGNGRAEIMECNIEAHFRSSQGEIYRYKIGISEKKVIGEEVEKDGKILLERDANGRGKITYLKIGNQAIHEPFQIDVDQICAVMRKDPIQHNFLIPLYEWGKNVRFVQFRKDDGQTRLVILTGDASKPKPAREDLELRQYTATSPLVLFREGGKRFGPVFKRNVCSDMRKAGFAITDIGEVEPTSLVVENNAIGRPLFVGVKERGHKCFFDQNDLSSGMFRTLATLIYLNYSMLAAEPSLIIVDDIGEGLDFERSTNLINLIRKKAKRYAIPLLMSTNDRFVMNRVPLREWILLKRKRGKVVPITYTTHQALFEKFEFTGLSNFDFFATDFIDRAKHLPEPRN